MRLGFSVRVLGKPGLRAYDGRRAASLPHLSVSLAHLRDVFAYLASARISMYRMAPDLAPYVTHPEWPVLHHQIDECRSELADAGALARAGGLRLSIHAPAHVALASADSAVVEQSTALLAVLAGLLDAMNQPAEAVIVVHSGGFAGGLHATIGRWVATWDRLPAAVRRRLVLEHDADGLTLPDALHIHAVTGVPVVFDYLHFLLNNPEGWTVREAVEQALASWPADVRPKVHFASQRTELRAVRKIDEQSGRQRWVLSPPRPGHHADYLNPWEFARFVQTSAGLRDFDVLLEAKAGDLALLHLRADLERYTPAVCALLDPAEVAG
ncbi:MAG: UV DNA damage repair endonuclease UvsE [Chloroflexota bacterium]|nr:UV DNA damage repair endonuclease UvsE [Chloroflexota bacterium]